MNIWKRSRLLNVNAGQAIESTKNREQTELEIAMKYENHVECKTLEVYKNYATAYEQAVRTDDWSFMEELFSDDIDYQLIAPPIITAKAKGRKNVADFYKMNHDSLDRPFPGKRVRGNINQLLIEDNYLKFSCNIIFLLPDHADIIVPQQEQIWLNANDQIEQIAISMSATELQSFINFMESYQDHPITAEAALPATAEILT